MTLGPTTQPRWAWLIWVPVGVVLAAIGAVLLIRPFASVNWLVLLIGLGLLVAGAIEVVWAIVRRSDPGAWRWASSAVGVLALVLGVLVLAWPGVTVGILVILVAILLAASGVRDLVIAFRPGRRQRWTNVLFGLASIIAAVTILAWPDVTVMAMGVLFGLWLIAAGVRLAVTALVERFRRKAPRPRRERPVVRGVLAVLAFAAALVIAFVGVRLSSTEIPDAFYTPPADLPAQPGVLLASETFTRSVPEGAQAWRILYTTTGTGEAPAVASALVVVPDSAGPHPVIGWTHGTTGVATGCAPSLLPEPFISGAMPDLHQALAAGWAVVATDYIGLGTAGDHAYVVGEPAGHAELDALRAARQLDGADLADETVLWGHSQGGHAALWTAGLAADYAPELDIVGVAAMAPAANLPALLESFAGSSLSLLFGAFVLKGYEAAYDDVHAADYVKPSARIVVDEIARRCLVDPATLVSVIQAGFSGGPVWSRDPSTGPLDARADENVPRLPIRFPLLLAQGLADPLIQPQAQQAYVDELCASGQALEYRTYEGRDHMGVVTGDSPLLGELMAWTTDRFAGKPAGDTC
ncbi:MAG TPA: lipase family protein [Microbacteriaceae bacterium]|nr:lipase family protein [Microbacteriaceae bacterium]